MCIASIKVHSLEVCFFAVSQRHHSCLKNDRCFVHACVDDTARVFAHVCVGDTWTFTCETLELTIAIRWLLQSWPRCVDGLSLVAQCYSNLLHTSHSCSGDFIIETSYYSGRKFSRNKQPTFIICGHILQ